MQKQVVGFGGTTPTGFKSEAVENITIAGKKRKLYKLSPIGNEINTIINLYNKFRELKSQTKLETYTLQNDIKSKNGKNYSRWSLKNILTNPVYAIADEEMYNYLVSLGITIYADKEAFDGIHGLMVYNKTEQKRF